MSYTTYYLKSTDKEALEVYVAGYRNVVEVTQGRAAITAGVDEEGFETPETPAAGDPTYWYTTVRLDGIELDEESPVDLCTEEEAAPVIGKWA